MKKKIVVGVTGLNAIDSPGPGIAVIRGLRDSELYDCRIIGFSYESLEPGIYMHELVDKTYQIPYPSAGAQVLYDRIAYINSVENLDVIIPNFDAELYSFMRLENDLEALEIKMLLPTMEQFEERHKYNLPEFGVKYQIDVPYSKTIFSSAEVYGLHQEFDYPLVVKGKYYDASIANNADQAVGYFNKISSKWGLPIIVQQYVSGTEYNLAGLGDGDGNLVAAIPMRKQYITDKGKAWGGISIDDKEMIEMAKKFVKNTKWKGGFELELMKSNDGKYYLLEINPRMPAWIYLTVGCGQNIPEGVVRIALGEKMKPYKEYKVGKMFVRYAWDMIVDVEEYQKIATFGEL
jgi:carbamoyl-phosphate synthase large subunit